MARIWASSVFNKSTSDTPSRDSLIMSNKLLNTCKRHSTAISQSKKALYGAGFFRDVSDKFLLHQHAQFKTE